MKEKIVLVGAGSAMFTRGLIVDLIKSGREVEVALADIDPQALDIAERLSRKMIDLASVPISVSADTDRRRVLSGATAVICTIGVGGRRGWEKDVYIPRKYGIYQTTGDSVLPGGTSRALRMIPAMVEIAQDVLDVTPQALFFNYGNPMGPICRAVRKATGANLIGLCHGVFIVGNYLGRVLGVSSSDFTYSAAGMNHLTWFTEFWVKGQDVRAKLHDLAEQRFQKYPEPGKLGSRFLEAEPSEGGDTVIEEVDPFSWSLFNLIGAFPAVLDRHVTEFFPQLFSGKGSYYGKTLGVDAFSFENTVAYGDRIFGRMKEDAFSRQPLSEDYFNQFSGEHEQVMDIIDHIRMDKKGIFSINLPNTGQVPNLPEGTIVESPAVAGGSGLQPIVQSPLPTAAAGILASRLMWAETVVEAALEGRRDKFVQALLLDGAVESLDVAQKLANELLEAHRKDLPHFFKKD